MPAAVRPVDLWPLFGLRVRTPMLELRYPDDDDVAALAALAAKGVHPPDFMPFNTPWTTLPSPILEQEALKFHWRKRAETSPEHWDFVFATVVDGEIVGSQGLFANDFPVRRSVGTGSWLGQAFQGRGIGKEMRAAALHLAFAELGAQTACSGAFVDNAASIAVSRALGYEDDGFEVINRQGSAARQLRFRLERERWEQTRRGDITVEGLAGCLPLLGLAQG